MKTIKVIDLLNKIANGEEVPKKIKYKGEEYQRYQNINSDNLYYYQRTKCPLVLLIENIRYASELNQEIEIIEEDKEIEHYDMFDNFTGFGFGGTDKELLSDLQNNFEHINEELDYLIKAVNKLKKGK